MAASWGSRMGILSSIQEDEANAGKIEANGTGRNPMVDVMFDAMELRRTWGTRTRADLQGSWTIIGRRAVGIDRLTWRGKAADTIGVGCGSCVSQVNLGRVAQSDLWGIP